MPVTYIEEISKHTAAVTDAMFGKISPVKPTVQEVLDMAVNLEQALDKLTKQYIDHRCNLDESMRFISDIISNLEGHQKDIEDGIE